MLTNCPVCFKIIAANVRSVFLNMYFKVHSACSVNLRLCSQPSRCRGDALPLTRGVGRPVSPVRLSELDISPQFPSPVSNENMT